MAKPYAQASRARAGASRAPACAKPSANAASASLVPAQPLQGDAAPGRDRRPARAQGGGAVEVGQRLGVLLQLQPGQPAVDVRRHEVGVALQRGRVVQDRRGLVAGPVEDASPVEVAPGELGPEARALAEVARGLDELAPLQVADPPLDHRPVMSGVLLQGLVQLGDGRPEPLRPRPAGPSRRRSGSGPGRSSRGSRSARRRASSARAGSPSSAPVPRPVQPQGARGRQPGDRLGGVEQAQGVLGGVLRTRGQPDAGVGQEQQQLAAILGHATAILGPEPVPGRGARSQSPSPGSPKRASVRSQAAMPSRRWSRRSSRVLTRQRAFCMPASCSRIRSRARASASCDRAAASAEPTASRTIAGRPGDRRRRRQPRVPAGELPRLLHAAQLGGVLQRAILQQPPQVVGQVVGPLVPPGRVGGQALAGDALQPPGEVRPIAADRGLRLAPLHRHGLDLQGQRRVAAALLERAVAREHLGQDHPQRVDVRPGVHLADQRRRAADQARRCSGAM